MDHSDSILVQFATDSCIRFLVFGINNISAPTVPKKTPHRRKIRSPHGHSENSWHEGAANQSSFTDSRNFQIWNSTWNAHWHLSIKPLLCTLLNSEHYLIQKGCTTESFQTDKTAPSLIISKDCKFMIYFFVIGTLCPSKARLHGSIPGRACL